MSEQPSQPPVNQTEPEKPLPWRPQWSKMHLWQFQPLRDVLVVLVVLGLLWLGQKISIVTVPVLLAIMLAYLFEPVIRWVTRKWNFQRRTVVAGILVGTVLFVAVPIALGLAYGVVQGVGLVFSLGAKVRVLNESVETQVEYDTAKARVDDLNAAIDEAEWKLGVAESEGEPAVEGEPTPEEIEKVLVELQGELEEAKKDQIAADTQAELALQALREGPGSSWVKMREMLLNESARAGLSSVMMQVEDRLEANADRLAASAASAGASVFQTGLRMISSTMALLFMAFLTGFFFFFIANEWTKFKVFTTRFVPSKHKETVYDLAGKFDRVISGFVRGRLTIAFLQSIVFTIGYLLIGVPAAFVLGPMVALLSIVPYLALVGVPVTIVLIWLENHTGIRGNALWVIGAPTVFYFIAQALDDYVWTPVIQGKETGMSTPMILFASLAGGVLFGVFGLLIAIPIAACLKIVIQELAWPRFKAWADGRAEDFLPLGR